MPLKPRAELEARAKCDYQDLVKDKLRNVPITKREDYPRLILALKHILSPIAGYTIPVEFQEYIAEISHLLQMPEMYVQEEHQEEYLALVRTEIAAEIESLEALNQTEQGRAQQQQRLDKLESAKAENQKTHSFLASRQPIENIVSTELSVHIARLEALANLVLNELISLEQLVNLSPSQFKALEYYSFAILHGKFSVDDILKASESQLTKLLQPPLNSLVLAGEISLLEAVNLTEAESGNLGLLANHQFFQPPLWRRLIRNRQLTVMQVLNLTESQRVKLQTFADYGLEGIPGSHYLSLSEVFDLTEVELANLRLFSEPSAAALKKLIEDGYLSLKEALNLSTAEQALLQDLHDLLFGDFTILMAADYRSFNPDNKWLICLPGIANLLKSTWNCEKLIAEIKEWLPHIGQLLLHPVNKNLDYTQAEFKVLAKIPAEYLAYQDVLNIRWLILIAIHVIPLELALKLTEEHKAFINQPGVMELMLARKMALSDLVRLSPHANRLNIELIKLIINRQVSLALALSLTEAQKEFTRYPSIVELVIKNQLTLAEAAGLTPQQIEILIDFYLNRLLETKKLTLAEALALSHEEFKILTKFSPLILQGNFSVNAIKTLATEDVNFISLHQHLFDSLDSVFEKNMQQIHWPLIMNLYQKQLLNVASCIVLLADIEAKVFLAEDLELIDRLALSQPELLKAPAKYSYANTPLAEAIQAYKSAHAIELIQARLAKFLAANKLGSKYELTATTTGPSWFNEKVACFNRGLAEVIQHINNCTSLEQIRAYLAQTKNTIQLGGYQLQFSRLIVEAEAKLEKFAASIEPQASLDFYEVKGVE